MGVEIEDKTKVFLESLDFEIEMRVSQKSSKGSLVKNIIVKIWLKILIGSLLDML